MDELNRALRQTAADRHLSSGERQALRETIQAAALNEHTRGVLRAQAFDLARELARGGDVGATLDWLEDVNKLLLPPTGDGKEPFVEAHFSPGVECVHRIVMLLQACHISADLCVFTITDDRIASAIDDARRHGVAVRIITDNDKAYDQGSDVQRLAQLGIPVRVDNSPYHMHHKFAVFDGAILLTGSYNWTRGAANNNEENLVISNDRRLLQAFGGEFERLWELFAGFQLTGR